MRYSIPGYRLVALLLLLVAVSAPEAGAQEGSDVPLSATCTIAYESGTASASATARSVPFTFEDGRVGSQSGSMGIELRFDRVTDAAFLKDLILIPQLTFRRTGASFVRPMPGAPVMTSTQSGPISQSVESRLEFAAYDFGLDGQFLYKIWGELGLTMGVGIGYRIVDKWRFTQVLLEPATARFVNPEGYPSEDGGRTLVFSDKSDMEFSRFATLLSYGLRYEVPVTSKITFIPEIGMTRYLNFGSSASSASNGWSGTSYGVRFTFRQPLDDDEEPLTPIVPPETSELDPPASAPPANPTPPPGPLTASIDLFTLDGTTREETMTLTTRENQRTLELALTPTVRFEQGSAGLPERYLQLDASTASRLSIDSLARLDTARIESHLLNIIGLRLQRSPRAKLRLVASRLAGESAADAERRAGSVRSYLGDVWKISPSRMTIETRRGAGDEIDVRLIGSASLLAPVRATWIERETVAAPLQIDPRIGGGVAPRTWTLTLRRGEEILARRTSESSGPLALDLSLANLASGELPAPVVAELTVRDAEGHVATARDTLGFVRGE